MLWRRWSQRAPYALFVGLNPSTADEYEDDPTIRRCKRFAVTWGFGALYMVNLFAVRATDPQDMLAHGAPVGPDNDHWLQKLAQDAGVVVCAWGNHGGHMGRDRAVEDLLQAFELMCLGTTKSGQPRHPLYVRGYQPLMPLSMGADR